MTDWGMLGCTSASFNSRTGGAGRRSRSYPEAKRIAATNIGARISAKSIDLLAPERATETKALISETENHTSRNESPYTPVHDAIWIKGMSGYCESPKI